jgi:sulfate permease, SulP family
VSLRPREIVTTLRTGANSRIAMVATFLATLFLPVAAAVGVGVVISLLLHLNQEAVDLTVVQLVPDDAGRFTEQAPPARVASESVTVLDVYGSLFYAGARTLEARLRQPGRPRLTGGAVLYESSPVVGASTLEAYNDATTWLVDGGERDAS